MRAAGAGLDNAKSRISKDLPPPRASVGTLYLIASTFHAARMYLERTLRKFGLTGIQYTILDMLARRRGQSAADLARSFFVSPQTMGEIVNGLERRGLIRRVESPDNRRVLHIRLSAEGRSLRRLAAKEAAKAESHLLEGLDARSVTRLRQLHFRLNTQFRRRVASDKPNGSDDPSLHA